MWFESKRDNRKPGKRRARERVLLRQLHGHRMKTEAGRDCSLLPKNNTRQDIMCIISLDEPPVLYEVRLAHHALIL